MIEDDVRRAVDGIAAHQRAVNPINEGDYRNMSNNGLVYCGKCHTPKECIVSIDGVQRTVPCLCECRKKEIAAQERRLKEEEQRRIASGLKDASLMSGKYRNATFERFYRKPENERQYALAKRYVENFDGMLKVNMGLLFYGPVGSGKSYTAACIANALMEEGVAVVFTSFVKVLGGRGNNDADERRFNTAVESVPLLIIDDLGAERYTDYAMEKVYGIVDSRLRADRPMILTTNTDVEDMKKEKEIRRRRIYDRVLEACYPVKFTGRSFREMMAGAKQKKAKEILEGRSDGV